jgi:hypothetical protein
MVKNTTGGGNAKKQARKYASSSSSSVLRKSASEYELYACVTKMSGGNLCRVVAQHGNDKLEICCHISGKFRGRNKRNNYISVGAWILVGLREWENPIKNCDLEYVYEVDEVDQLRNLPGINLKHILVEICKQQNFGNAADVEEPEDNNCQIVFSENVVSKDDINKIISGNITNVVKVEEEIDIDDL